jgi:hypothetical protein
MTVYGLCAAGMGVDGYISVQPILYHRDFVNTNRLIAN